jgi:hypothetical protein
MLPICAAIPVPLLVGGRRQLRRLAFAKRHWRSVWTAAGSIAVVVEAVFLFRLTRILLTPYANLSQPSWHALEFSLAFAVAGAAMALALVCGTRPLRDPQAGS